MAAAPAWGSKTGPARVLQEFRSISRAIAATPSLLPNVKNLGLVGDDVNRWTLELHPPFDVDLEGGRLLNADLARLEREAPGRGHIIMEVSFPEDYPASPFFLRVVQPRMQIYTGHVTVGGSVCIEMLTRGGSANSWVPSLCVEAVLTQVIINALTTERVIVRTQSGPGGRAGPLRIDFSGGAGGALREYSRHEADRAFERSLAHHRVAGWGNSGGGNVALHTRPAPPQPRAPPAQAPVPAPSPAVPAKPKPRPPPPLLPAVQPSPGKGKRPADSEPEVIELLDSDDDAPGPSSRQPPAKRQQHRQQRQAGGIPSASASIDVDLTAGDGPATFPARPRGGRAAGSQMASARAAAGDAGVKAAAPAQVPAPAPVPVLLPPPSTEQRLAAANERTGLDLVLPPEEWRVTDDLLHGRQVFVELPLPPGCAGVPASGAVTAAVPHEDNILELTQNGIPRDEAIEALERSGGDVEAALLAVLHARTLATTSIDEEDISELMMNGVSRADAVAALKHTGGNLPAALLYSFDCVDRGGAAAVAAAAKRAEQAGARGSGDGGSSSRAGDAEACERREEEALRRRELQREAAVVVARFEASQGVKRDRIAKIERVQNLVLWSDYQRRRAKVAHAAGPHGANEQLNWHGADPETLAIICEQGFDSRVSNLSGALGAGVYVAKSSTYSDAYSRSGAHAAGGASAHAYPGIAAAALAGLVPGWPGYAGGGARARAQHAAAYAAPAHHATKGVRPGFVPGTVAMLLCRCAMGRVGQGGPQMRRPPSGSDSVTSGNSIFAVYHNDQLYPAHIIHYR